MLLMLKKSGIRQSTFLVDPVLLWVIMAVFNAGWVVSGYVKYERLITN